MIELEKTYLPKYLPDLSGSSHCILHDFYIPNQTPHPHLRLRQRGTSFEITKKVNIDNDPAKHFEHTIPLTEAEFRHLQKEHYFSIKKTRYYFPYQGLMAEIDIFHAQHQGLITIDFEFQSQQEMDAFTKPDFCLVDITTQTFIAGGILCQTRYQDIESLLLKLGYVQPPLPPT